MKAIIPMLMIISIAMGSDHPHQDTTTSLPQPIIPFELTYHDIRQRIHSEPVNGRITVEFIIDESGTVIQPNIIDTFNVMLNDVIIDKILKTKYKPAIQNGKPVSVKYHLPILFK